mgnify:FL=1
MSKKHKKKSYKLAKLIIKAVFALAALITAVAKLIATLESVSYALNVPIERFVEYITPGMASQETAANECYNLILEQTPRTQKRLLAILQNMSKLHQIQ